MAYPAHLLTLVSQAFLIGANNVADSITQSVQWACVAAVRFDVTRIFSFM